MGNSRFRILFLMFVFTFLSFIKLNAQDRDVVIIEPLKYSSAIKWKTDVFVYGLGGSTKNGSLYTATNGNLSTMTDYDIYNTFMDFGISTSFYRNRLLRYNASVGYMYSRYAINRGIRDGGFNSNWITLDLSISVQLGYGLFINGGLKGNLFLSGSNTPSGEFQYLGLNNDCYNKFSNNWYVGAAYNIKFIKLEFKFGSYMAPLLNANKIAYYNLGKTHVEGLFFEFGLGVKIFSTASKYTSIID